jgi:hypothetical protein
MSFTQINLNSHPEWNEDVKKLSYFFTKSIEQYKKDCAIGDEMWPSSYAFEEFRMKRYLANGKDQFFNIDISLNHISHFTFFEITLITDVYIIQKIF